MPYHQAQPADGHWVGEIAYCNEQTCYDTKKSSNPDANSSSRDCILQYTLHDRHRSSMSRAKVFGNPRSSPPLPWTGAYMLVEHSNRCNHIAAG